MAMWIVEVGKDGGGQPFPFRKAGASRKEGAGRGRVLVPAALVVAEVRRRSKTVTIRAPSIDVEIVRGPEAIERARSSGVETEPRFPLPAPMQETHRSWMEISAESVEIIAAQSVLVPSVLNSFHLSGEN